MRYFRYSLLFPMIVSCYLPRFHSTSDKCVEQLVSIHHAVPPGLAVESCSVDVQPFDQKLLGVTEECSLAGGNSVRRFVDTPDDVDYKIKVLKGEDLLRTVDPSPKSGITSKQWFLPSLIACDTEIDRIYFVHGLLGYVSAFRSDGMHLWTAQLPNFKSFPLTADPKTLPGLAMAGEISVPTNIVTSGEYLAVEYRTEGFRHAIYHRSGELVGVVGPWDGLVRHSATNGWLFAAGGVQGNDSVYLPTVDVKVVVSDRSAQRLVEHFIAWLQPERDATSYTFRKCDAMPPNLIAKRLKERYVEADAIATKQVHDQLGTAWLTRVINESALPKILTQFQPSSEDWIKRFTTALLEAGADVDLMKAMHETPVSTR